ncbi:filamentous hemagglutinin N-terminal domain-containing protein [Burkholderia metallica]|uniref:filamentous hemagglutinin N-terminal domain-containing protein n=1 Tax=Burkholderia metallica TaxID=488729 RepID=UPI00131EAA50|nr:filamentous hemagglutinin N-terminal domain-containing protein [Burkholderia metallica]
MNIHHIAAGSRRVPTLKRSALWLAGALHVLCVQSAFAQSAPVPAAGGAGAPRIAAANGVPVVDIVAPNAAGVSHNRFAEYGVGPNGLILNNSATAVGTVLGGRIDGNAQLGGTPARVILNEVTGSNASHLLGATEIAGPAARLVVANPNGITANGARFINASDVKLVAGVPVFDGNGNANGFDTKGELVVEGNGLDTRGVARTDLVARTLRVNAKLQAERLVATAIDGHVAFDGDDVKYTVAQSPDLPPVAIDVSQLGSIHANAITLVGKGTNVGVNVDGRIEAIAGAPLVRAPRGVASALGIVIGGGIDGGTVNGGEPGKDAVGVIVGGNGNGNGSSGSGSGSTGGIAGSGTPPVTGVINGAGADGAVRMSGGTRIGGALDGVSAQLNGGTQVERSAVVNVRDTLAANGGLTNDGKTGAGSMSINGGLSNTGTLDANRTLAVNGGLKNTGQLRATALSVNGGLSNAGKLAAAGALSVNGGLTNTDDIRAASISVNGGAFNSGSLVADGALSVNGGLTNAGLVRAATMKVFGGVSNSGTLRGDRSVMLFGPVVNRAGATISSGGGAYTFGKVSNAGKILRYVAR